MPRRTLTARELELHAPAEEKAAAGVPRRERGQTTNCRSLVRAWLGDDVPGPLGPGHSQPDCYRQWEAGVKAALSRTSLNVS